MIEKQMILNALGGANSSGSFGGWIAGGMSLFSGGGAGGWVTSVLHEGGIVGAGSTARLAPPQHWFANAVRMHSGGFVGLNPSEVPAIPPTGRGSAVEIGSEERAEWGRRRAGHQY
jgi:hypothetical protein